MAQEEPARVPTPAAVSAKSEAAASTGSKKRTIDEVVGETESEGKKRFKTTL